MLDLHVATSLSLLYPPTPPCGATYFIYLDHAQKWHRKGCNTTIMSQTWFTNMMPYDAMYLVNQIKIVWFLIVVLHFKYNLIQ